VVVLFYKVFSIFTRANTIGRLPNTSGLNFPSIDAPFTILKNLRDFPAMLRGQTTIDSWPVMDEASTRMLTSLNRPGGAVAQLGARLDGIEEVVGSNPIGSTKNGRRVPVVTDKVVVPNPSGSTKNLKNMSYRLYVAYTRYNHTCPEFVR
jgi:hypothetical protein